LKGIVVDQTKTVRALSLAAAHSKHFSKIEKTRRNQFYHRQQCFSKNKVCGNEKIPKLAWKASLTEVECKPVETDL